MKLKNISKRFGSMILVLSIVATLSETIYAIPISTLAAGGEPTAEAAFTTSDNGDGSCKITGYNSAQSLNHPTLVIPDVIGGNTVTSIDDNAFTAKGLSSLSIPDTVTSIGTSAFSSNNFVTVKIPDGVTSIGDYTFSANKFVTVKIPDGVTSIGNSAFSNNLITSVTIPGLVTSIGDYAFYNNKFTTFMLPASVTTVGTDAFGAQTSNTPYRVEGSEYTVRLPDDIDMSKVTLAQNSSYTLDVVKKEASTTDNTKPNLAYDYDVPYGTAGQTTKMSVDATLTDEEFKVMYLGKDGTPELKTEYLASGGIATPPTPDPVDGFTFTGWDKDVAAPITAHITFTAMYTAVVKSTPTAADFTYAEPGDLTYNKTEKTATVTAKVPDEVGAITIKYAKKTSDGSYDTPTSTAPVNVGEYKVYIDVTEGTKYSGATDVTDDAWEFTISKATLTPDQPTLTAFEGQTLNDVVGSMDVTGGTWTWDSPLTTSVGAVGANSFAATFTPNDPANYDTVSGTLTVTVTATSTPTPTAADFTYAEPGDLTYNKTEKTANVTAKVPDEVGAITIKYAKKTSDGSYDTPTSTAPVNVGEYKVYIDVTEGTKYSGTTDVTDDAWKFTINQGDPTPDQPTLTAFEGQTLSDVAGSMVVTGGTWIWDAPLTTSVGAVGTNSFAAIFIPTDTNYKTFGVNLVVKVSAKTESIDPVDPIDPPKPSDPEDPEVTKPVGNGGRLNSFATGDAMTRYNTMYGLIILLVVSGIGLRFVIPKKKFK